MPQYETLKVERRGDGLMIVTLNRPDVRNAINTQCCRDLREVFLPLRFSPGDVRCVIVTGAGDKAFSAGGDLKERHGMIDEVWRAQHAIIEEAFYAIIDSNVPVIAAVNGAAFGGGLEMALCCDFIYAVHGARFALTEVSLGIMPGGCGTQNLPRAVGSRRAKEIILTAKPFTAEEGYEWGLINRLCAPAELLPAAIETATRICENAPIAVRQAKKSVDYGMQMDIHSAVVFEIQAYERMISTEDRHEGVRAFNEKRKPRFQGR
jgi:enoyl-CoA hydratase/carnithine racemase